jgi:hypothetical protein
VTIAPAADLIQLAPPGLSCACCWSAAEVVDGATGALLCIPCANHLPRPGIDPAQRGVASR